MRPQLWVIAGPNGAGKSTLVKRHILGKIEVALVVIMCLLMIFSDDTSVL